MIRAGMEWLFCYLDDAQLAHDINWREEAEAAEDCGFTCYSFDYAAFLEESAEAALDEIPDGEGQELVYRGWMMQADDYVILDDLLSSKGYRLLSRHHSYAETLLLPNYFDQIKDLSPAALWTEEPDIEEAWELAQKIGTGPWIVRDHMKSAKGAWLEACFVPENATFAQFESICQELRNHREPNFVNGFVVRPYLPLVQLAAPRSGPPVCEEYRLIFWRGQRILSMPYDELGGLPPDLSRYDVLADRIDSPFFVADVARQQSGDLTLLELNPGGCAGLPPQLHPIEFYSRIAEIENGGELSDDFLGTV